MPASALLESLVALTVLLSTLGHGVTAFTRWRDATGELLAATRDQAAEEHQGGGTLLLQRREAVAPQTRQARR